jgi:hypothetical protein
MRLVEADKRAAFSLPYGVDEALIKVAHDLLRYVFHAGALASRLAERRSTLFCIHVCKVLKVVQGILRLKGTTFPIVYEPELAQRNL